jgi:hypothetical protein
MTRIEQLRKIVDNHEAGLVDNQWVDATTANMLVKVYEALQTDELRDKFESLRLMTLIEFGWKHVRVA